MLTLMYNDSYLSLSFYMFKQLLLSAFICIAASSAFADITISEKIRKPSKSVLNPNFSRLAIPATPHEMSLPDFGRGIIGWGTGPTGAETRLNNITQADVDKIKTQDVTLDMVQTWQKFYENETQRNPGNPTAPFRAELMKKIANFW